MCTARRVAAPVATALLLAALAGCATSKQQKEVIARLDQMSTQLDALVENTRRDTLSQIFGEQSGVIVSRIDSLDQTDRQQFEQLLGEYQKGATSLEDVRQGMVTLLGGGEREVSASSGIWVRDATGAKLKAVSRGTAFQDCRQLATAELPATIASDSRLTGYAWGTGTMDGQQVVFPWDFTMSSFTREIVENTARRTAEEFMRMSGDKGFTRPVYIQVTTDQAGDVKIAYPSEEGEIYLVNDKKGQPSANSPAPAPQGK